MTECAAQTAQVASPSKAAAAWRREGLNRDAQHWDLGKSLRGHAVVASQSSRFGKCDNGASSGRAQEPAAWNGGTTT
eukprot:CAMPEP_0176297498 /NCGR_PEP_ID=MMETSP0121_2-20121125/58752_1 /TAXON_ID=160619 /ORGANISM="Kryptoperidinium foliaceum, Strain CCMP 1326" /LENGTH=76 /DNA_ID=CAMNT_0017638687 /DNA_START=12 /DNA_END=239 /DNA_ORIENTATION=+